MRPTSRPAGASTPHHTDTRSPRPPRGARERPLTGLSIYPVIDLREDVVARLEVGHDRLLQRHLGLERAVEVREARHVVARALLGVLHGGARLHDEGPV